MNRPAIQSKETVASLTWRATAWKSILRYIRMGGIFIVLIFVAVVMSFASPYFLTARNLMNILLQAATLSIIAFGETLVLLIGEIDLSIGSIEGFTGALAAVLLIIMGVPTPVGILVALCLGLAVGLINGIIFVKGKIPSFIVTLAMLGIAQGAGMLLTAGRPVNGFPHAYSWFGQGFIWRIPVPIVIALAVFVVVHLMLTRTRLGVFIYAVGGGRRASELAGIPVERMLVTVYVISGLLAAISGIVMTSRLDSAQGTYGQYDLLDAVASVVIGGTSLLGGVGTVVGTAGGVLIIATIRNGLVLLNVQTFWQQIVVGVIIILAVLIDQVGKRRSPGT